MKMMLLVILILQIVILLHLPYERLTANFKRLFRTKNSKDSTAPEKNPTKYYGLTNKPLLKAVVEDIGGNVMVVSWWNTMESVSSWTHPRTPTSWAVRHMVARNRASEPGAVLCDARSHQHGEHLFTLRFHHVLCG